MTYPFVQTILKDGIATITFGTVNHNALPTPILIKLKNEILAAGMNDVVKVIVLKSAGERTFCAGADFDELLAIEDKENGKAFFMGFANVILAIKNCKKIVLGRVQGKAVGGGVGLASAVDYCFATTYASVKLSEISIGIGPNVIGPAVQRKIGLSAFSQLTLNAKEFYSAQWAQRQGLYASVFESVAEMDDALNTMAINLASYNPESLGAIKEMFWENTSHWELLLEERAKTSGNLVLSEFTKATLRKFKS